MWRKGNLVHCWWECRLVQPLWKKQYGGSSKNKKMGLPYDPVIPLLDMYMKKPKTLIWKNICISVFIVALFTIAKIWKQPKRPSVDKLLNWWYIYTMEYNSSIKKNEILQFATAWMDLVSWRNKSERDKYHMISFICGI